MLPDADQLREHSDLLQRLLQHMNRQGRFWQIDSLKVDAVWSLLERQELLQLVAEKASQLQELSDVLRKQAGKWDLLEVQSDLLRKLAEGGARSDVVYLREQSNILQGFFEKFLDSSEELLYTSTGSMRISYL